MGTYNDFLSFPCFDLSSFNKTIFSNHTLILPHTQINHNELYCVVFLYFYFQ